MTMTSIGDLAQGFTLRARNTELQRTLTSLQTEVTTGRSADPVARLDGHLSYLSRIEGDLAKAESFGTAAKEVQIVAGIMQTSLTRIGTLTEDLVGTVSTTRTAAGAADVATAATSARGVLDSIVSALNTSAAGRQVFSGTAVKTAPLASADTLLADLEAAVAGASSHADMAALADAFFDAPGGGFETRIYQGAADGLAPVRLGAGEAAEIDLRADHPAFRETLKHVAIAALADDPDLALADSERRAAIEGSMDGLLAARDAQIAVQADLGVAEERIERASVRLETEATTLRMARNDLLAVDPYEAATELESVRTQLETLYEVTARTSRLSLVNFLS
jgi:flagellar hook-associated protein 3 FlgL